MSDAASGWLADMADAAPGPSINPIPGNGPRWWKDSEGMWWYKNLITDFWEPFFGRVSDAWDTMEDWEEDPKAKRHRPS